jgi:hypothetical protein
MPDTLQHQSLTSYIKEIRIVPVRKPPVNLNVTTQVKALWSKTRRPVYVPDLPFEEWNLPPQAEGYIKCGKHDFL